MTCTHSQNCYGVFKTKKARDLAFKYNLPNNINSYITIHKTYVSLEDVYFIIDNLWLDHFMYNSPKPIYTSPKEYNQIYKSIKNKYPQLIH